jgi:hypothetical protein
LQLDRLDGCVPTSSRAQQFSQNQRGHECVADRLLSKWLLCVDLRQNLRFGLDADSI